MYQPSVILPAATAVPHRTVPAGALLAGMIGLFVTDDLLLARFLGLAHPLPIVVGAGAGLVLCRRVLRDVAAAIPLRRLLLCFALGLVLVVLGGEGRLFYANPDWQVRDAVLADMVRLPWPFAYVGPGSPMLLRAPIGMYLLPALAGKLGGQTAADWALAVQNGALLGTILALGSLLADDARARRILAVVAIGFGGLDTLGAALVRPGRLWPLTRSIEDWGPTVLPSPISSLFWTPQHAIAGFVGALLFLLWRTGRAPLWLLPAAVPLVALWSPLGAIGALPFVAFAGFAALVRGRVRPADLVLPLVALVPAAIPLLYLSADAARVGASLIPLPLPVYLVFETFEVVPVVLGTALLMRGGRYGAAPLVLATAFLAVSPLVGIGESVDFTMRASIPALGILSVLAAEALAQGKGHGRTLLVAALAIGALGPARDVARAIAFRPAPPPLCDFSRAWDQGFATFGKETYLARLSAVPAAIRPAAPVPAPPLAPPRCWTGPWKTPRF